MNCCKNKNDNDKGNSHKGMMSHMLMMILCCGLPAIIFLLLPVIGTAVPGARNVLISVVSYLCPVMMVLMILMMLRNHKSEGKNGDNCETKHFESKDLK